MKKLLLALSLAALSSVSFAQELTEDVRYIGGLLGCYQTATGEKLEVTATPNECENKTTGWCEREVTYFIGAEKLAPLKLSLIGTNPAIGIAAFYLPDAHQGFWIDRVAYDENFSIEAFSLKNMPNIFLNPAGVVYNRCK